ncbi:MAG: hypothetical protein O3B87_02145, partial [bacterium]|nr:hypothetical protein [bacterium]
RERKIEELDTLKVSLDIQQDSLVAQQAAKANLLSITKSDENTYQQLLESARAELNTIQQAVKYLQQSGEAVPVSKGDFIGVQGSTGYSTGDHLHFGVYNYSSIADLVGNWYYNNWEDPGNVLPSRQVEWSSGCGDDGTKTVGNGSFGWEWPISNLKYITQGAGHTCYSDVYYKGNPHPAWDMAGPINTSIYAVDSGNAYYCRNCLGDGGNGVFVFHPNGKMTMYWHVK